MLQVHLLGQFDIRSDGKRVTIPSRAAQSLFAFLILSAGTPHRREKLAAIFWPETSDENARRYLRQELWRLRKALSAVAAGEYLVAEEFTLTFDRASDYWLDVTQLEKPDIDTESLISNVSLYRGELLPGFYDDWIALERERVQGVFESKMRQLLEQLVTQERWVNVQEWAERWLALGDAPEPAYRALMLAYGARGDMGKVAVIYQRCTDDLREQLDVEPSAETRALYDGLLKGAPAPPRTATVQTSGAVTFLFTDIEGSTRVKTRFPGTESPTPGEPPFKGLQYFDVVDADLYFGREALTQKLLNQLRESHFLSVVVGASGSGKSSLVRAGLIPALRATSDDWRIHIMTPTAHPLEALAATLTRGSESVTATATLMDDLERDPRSLQLYLRRISNDIKRAPTLVNRHHLLVVDQFEELFTLCHDELEREQFIDNLLDALGKSKSRTDGGLTLVLTLRADFYAHLAQYPELRDAVATHQEYIGPMTMEELRRAIEEPAKLGTAIGGTIWEFEPGLVDLILRDVGDEPGALPLLSHALLETWKRRAGHIMTLKGYADAGGVHGAIAHTAEGVYDTLSSEQQAIALSVFLRLTELGEGTEDTRRRVSFDEVLSDSEDAEQVRGVINLLAEARLITVGQDTVEVAHEALIREWSRLREWLNQDREGLRLHRSLTEAAQEWELLERDPGALYRGARLVQAKEWFALHPNTLNAPERTFLNASNAQEERETREREQAQQRELASAKELVESSRRLADEQQARAQEAAKSESRLRRRAYAIAAAFVLAMLLAGLALVLGEQARTSAAVAQENAARAEAERRIATVRELAASAVSNLTVDPERSILLALSAMNKTYAVDHTVLPEALDALHRAFQALRIELTVRGHTDEVWSAVYSPDGARIATASADGTAKVRDATTGKELFTLKAANGTVWYAAFSPDGKLLATAGSDYLAHIWDAAGGEKLRTLAGHADEVFHIEFSPDSSRVVTVSPDGTAKVWDAFTGEEQLSLNQGDGARPYWGTYSPDGSRIAVANTADGNQGWASIWDAVTGAELVTLPRQNGYVNSVAFSPDGTRIVTTSDDQSARIWDVRDGQELLTLYSQTVNVVNAAFSPDGKHVATANGDRHIIVWDAFTGQQVLDLPSHASDILTVAYSPDGSKILTASRDQTAKVWNVGPSREDRTLINSPPIASPIGAKLAYSPDGSRLAVAFSDPVAKIWSTTNGQPETELAGHTEAVNFIAYSADGARLATVGGDGTARVWDAVTGKELLTIPIPTELVVGAAFSPDGTRLGTASFDPVAQVWEAETGERIHNLVGHKEWLTGITFSPDGSRIATSSFDTTAMVWDAVTGKEVLTLVGHQDTVRQVVYSPDGTRIATAGLEGIARVWDASSGKELLSLRGHTGSVFAVAYSHDGKFLATASGDKTAKIWDALTGQELQTLYAEDGLTGVAFSPDGTQLAVASRDGTNRFYLLRVEDLMALARERVSRPLTTEECKQYLHVATCPMEP